MGVFLFTLVFYPSVKVVVFLQRYCKERKYNQGSKGEVHERNLTSEGTYHMLLILLRLLLPLSLILLLLLLLLLYWMQ